ncbi:hypothetical protein [Fulvivirga lutimaris]|uniref:hypothetical protein n=1 Tax=Fulvivirga lutimaris TaxID=1819566 RepID=UPI0012BC7919|nr:hypothetical protein [Fulvivirga lutimaris]MTI39172.1 hypothetical protein [Fulvivirga lutimaris]
MKKGYFFVLIILCLTKHNHSSAAIFDSKEGIIEIYFNRTDIDGNRIISIEQIKNELNLAIQNADSVNVFYSYLALSISIRDIDKSLMIENIINAYSYLPHGQGPKLLPYLKLAEAISYYHLGNPREALNKITQLQNGEYSNTDNTLAVLIKINAALFNGVLGNEGIAEDILLELPPVVADLDHIDKTYRSFLALNITNTLGISYLVNRQVDKAEETILKGISMAGKMNEGRMLANFQGNLSNIYFLQNKYHKALEYAMLDFKFSQKKDNARSVFGLAGIIAECYFQIGKIDSTEKYIQTVFTLLPEINEPFFIDNNLSFLLDYYNKTDQYQKLISTTKFFNQIKDSIAQVRLSKDYEIIQSQIDLERAQEKINQLTQINQLENQRRMAVQKYNVALMIGILSIILLAIFIYRNLTQKRKQNLQLEKKNAEINSQNEELKSQQETLRTQSDKIAELNTLLEQKVNERTKELLLKNKKLEDYAHYNSHNIRGPLARILGLIHLWETQSIQQSEKEDMLNRIEQSAKELDEMVRKVNQMLE